MSAKEVRRDSFHARIYSWWYTHTHYTAYSPYSTNLCSYMRVVLIYALVRAIFDNWICVWGNENFELSLNMLTIPALSNLLMATTYVISIAIKELNPHQLRSVLILFSAMSWIVSGIMFVASSDWLHDIELKRRRERRNKFFDPIPPKAEKKVSRFRIEAEIFLELIADYIRAGHDRICPEVVFTVEPRINPPQLPTEEANSETSSSTTYEI